MNQEGRWGLIRSSVASKDKVASHTHPARAGPDLAQSSTKQRGLASALNNYTHREMMGEPSQDFSLSCQQYIGNTAVAHFVPVRRVGRQRKKTPPFVCRQLSPLASTPTHDPRLWAGADVMGAPR